MTKEKTRLVAEFQKNSLEKVRIHLQEFHGQTYCDIRVWVAEKAGQSGAECATRKGLTLNVELLGELRSAIDEAIRALEDGSEVGHGRSD
jgi:hypothetical protein